MELYTTAASVLEKFENKQGSVKSLVFAAGFKNIRQLYALVCESLKYQPVLMTIFKGSHSLQQEEDLQGQGHLATVLLYEHLVGKGLGRAGQIRKCIMKHRKEIQEKCEELLAEKGVTSLVDLLSLQCQTLNKLPIPRYVRVNLLKTTVEDTVTAFTEEGWVWRGALNLHSFRQEVEGLGEEGFGSDPLLPDLLVFPPGTDLHDHPWVTQGCLVLQDRASCFPAHVLNPSQGSTVLDCCAAPGNKTSHTASIMGSTGKIWAFERDAKRMSLLQQQLRKTGVSNTKTVHQDFLSVDPYQPQFSDVQYVLVDPSCSGSGIMSRMDHVNTTPNTKTSSRLLSLQRFQISILKHALRFPNVRRVVYSTCSIHAEENEQVVSEVAQQVQGKFELAAIFPEFPHREVGGGDIAEKCLRMSPEEDLTNGFFVACFDRVSEASADEIKTGKKGAFDSNTKNCHGKAVKEGMGVSMGKKNRKRKHGETDTSISEETETGKRGDVLDAGSESFHGEVVEEGEDVCPGKKKKKRKRGGEIEHTDSVPGVNSLHLDVSSPQSAKAEPVGEEGVGSSQGKKNRKRKLEGEVEGSDSVCGVSGHDADPSPSQNAERDPEDCRRPKKKKKKKPKSKRDETNGETEGEIECADTEAGISGYDLHATSSQNAERDPEDCRRPKKKKKKKQKSKQDETNGETEGEIECADSEPGVSGCDSHTTSSQNAERDPEDCERPKKKKKKKSSQEETNGECDGVGTVPENPVLEGKGTQKKKKKKQEKCKQDKTNGESDSSEIVPENQSLESKESKKKKKKRKKSKQE